MIELYGVTLRRIPVHYLYESRTVDCLINLLWAILASGLLALAYFNPAGDVKQTAKRLPLFILFFAGYLLVMMQFLSTVGSIVVG